MTPNELRTASDDILREWGIGADTDSGGAKLLVLDTAFVDRWAKDLRCVIESVARLARTSALSIGKAACRFTHGAGADANAVSSAFVGRPDFVICNGEPRLLELNADSSVGGLVQISELSDLYRSSGCYPRSMLFRSPMESFANYLHVASPHAVPVIVLVSSRSFSSYYQQQAVEMSTWLANRLSCDCVVAFPDDLDVGASYVTCDGRDVSIAVKLDTMIDESPTSDLADVLKRSAHTQTVFVSDNSYINVEDKACLALLRDLSARNSPSITADERAAIDRLITPTWLLGTHPAPSAKDWRSELQREQDRYVLKRVFSFGGATVTAGLFATEERWEAAVDAALLEPELWVAQEFVQSDRIVLGSEYGRLQPAAAGSAGERCVISPYLFDDTIGGFLCRTLKSETDAVIGLQSPAPMGVCVVAETPESA